MTITELGDLLRAAPMAWRDIPDAQRAIAEAALLPSGAFNEQQREWLAHWRLACAAADVDAINAVLPEGVRVAATEIEGALYLGADLLTDSLTPGGTYYPATAILQGLICRHFDAAPSLASDAV